MPEHDDRSPYGPPEGAPPQIPTSLGEVRALVERLSAEDRARAAARGPVARGLYAACAVVAVLAAAALLYGALTFPDAPIRWTPAGYAGKTGTPHAAEHYELYRLWVKAAVTAFALALLTGFGGLLAERRGR